MVSIDTGNPSAAGRIRRVLSGLVANKDQQEAAEAALRPEDVDAEPIETCVRGTRATLCGTVKSVTIQPRAGVPGLEVDLFDGTGHVTLIWLGRRSIAGIDPGRRLTVTGRITCDVEHRQMFNPRYELHPVDSR